MPLFPVASVLVRVAKEVGPSFRAVAKQPYALTLYLFCVLLDGDRIERAIEDSVRLDNASLTALAFHEPKKLGKLERSITTPPVTRSDREDRMQQAKELIEKKRKQGEAKANGKL